MIRLLPLLTLLLLALAGPAAAMVKLPEIPVPVEGNPADRLLSLPIEDSASDPARKCTPKASRPGMLALQRWLEANARGVSWGSYRCEKRGKGQASLHSENRAMGVAELIWDCGYWGAGMTQFSEYGACYGKRGKLKRNVNKTVAHRDHVHIGMTKRGAAARTSFWSRGR